MTSQHAAQSATLPRGFRYHHNEGSRPTTPEALDAQELQQPSPPRPARLKVRRRLASSFHAPTAQFLASVAAADVPIPTIEEPQVVTSERIEDLEMPDREPLSIRTSGFLTPLPNSTLGSPPRTPMPILAMEDGYSHHPDWSAGAASSPRERPISSHSNSSGFSDDSIYSGSRVSRRSEDGSCTSPESDIVDPFQSRSFSKGKGKAKAMYRDESAQQITTLNAQLHSKTRKDAPWTKPQSAHLWSTYLQYLQDPTVTPFRIGASAIPPQGIVHRVTRQAVRSWKGPQARRSARLSSVQRSFDKSGSITPTAEAPQVYGQWPHSSSATRLHLREMCKSKDSNPVQRHHHLQSRSPTPFTKPYRSIQVSEAPRISSAFNTKDISLSLATSTADSMQPDGPLAKLAASEESADTPVSVSTFPQLENFKPLSFGESRGRRLGSPFARSYGPSSSKTLVNALDRTSPPRTMSRSVVEPSLGSPVRFEEPRSLNGTMKRRAQHSLDEELSPSGAVLRPSILDEQLFGGPMQGIQRRVRSRGFSLGDEAFGNRIPGLFQPSPLVPDLPTAIEQPNASTSALPCAPPKLLPALELEQPRLGSPFSESGPSKTFPRRLLADGASTIRRSQFATMHQTRRSIESFDFGEGGPSLQSRLTHLDDKLKEIREREAAARQDKA